MAWLIGNVALPNFAFGSRFTKVALQRDLSSLNRLSELQLPEAVAFYTGRVVEMMAHEGVRRIGHEPGESSADDLELLGYSGRLDDGYLACGNSLRRIGNAARHMHREIQPTEEPTIIAMLQVWIEGFAKNLYQSKNSVESANDDPQWSEMTPWIRGLSGDSKQQISQLVQTRSNDLELLLHDASTAAFAGERLTDCDAEVAEKITSESMDRFSNDLRIRQVRALCLSRSGKMEQAVNVARKIYGKAKEDPETLGILGGAYKKWWFASNDHHHLEAAHRCYSTRTVYPSYYLLINAAATALWMGRKEDARGAAQEALEALNRYNITPEWALQSNSGYWFIATLAEAQLLWEKPKQALRLYEHAKDLETSHGRWEVTRKQLERHLDFLPHLRDRFASLINI